MLDMVCGLETEYAIRHFPDIHRPADRRIQMGSDELFRRLYRAFKEIGVAMVDPHSICNSVPRYEDEDEEPSKSELAGCFTDGGARFYFDNQSNPEYSAPPCKSPLDAVAATLVGTHLLREALCKVQQATLSEGIGGRVVLLANNVDLHARGGPRTWGRHDNYQLPRVTDGFSERDLYKKIIAFMIPYFATRQVFSGNGHFNGRSFELSSRARFTLEEISDSTEFKRPIINLRDEPLASRCFRRLHIISGDTNMNEEIMWLSLGITRMLLDLAVAN